MQQCVYRYSESQNGGGTWNRALFRSFFFVDIRTCFLSRVCVVLTSHQDTEVTGLLRARARALVSAAAAAAAVTDPAGGQA